MKILIPVLFLCMNLLCFFLYFLDKRKAQKGKWRIPERVLLIVPFLGGGIGAWLGMKCLHHKTLHTRFRILVPAAALVSIAELVLLLKLFA